MRLLPLDQRLATNPEYADSAAILGLAAKDLGQHQLYSNLIETALISIFGTMEKVLVVMMITST